MSGARAMFAGPGARRVLVRGARGEVECVLAQGTYVRLGAEWLGLAGPRAPFGPLTLVVRGRLHLRPGAPALVTGCRLVLGECTISLERMRDRRPIAIDRPQSPSAIRAAVAATATVLPTAPAPLRPGLAALAEARIEDAVILLAGRGDGLTPAGDDVLAGYAAARLAVGMPVALSPAAAARSSPLGLAYLRCAERGELPDVAALLLGSLCRGSPTAARAALGPLMAWGASSGTALAWGMNAGAVQFN